MKKNKIHSKWSVTKKTIIFAIGILFLLLGFVGLLIPVFPTTPFLIVAVYCFSKSSKRFEKWIVNHKYFGPPVNDWRQNRIISKNTKILSIFLLLCSTVMIVYLEPIATPFKFLIFAVIILSVIFILIQKSK